MHFITDYLFGIDCLIKLKPVIVQTAERQCVQQLFSVEAPAVEGSQCGDGCNRFAQTSGSVGHRRNLGTSDSPTATIKICSVRM